MTFYQIYINEKLIHLIKKNNTCTRSITIKISILYAKKNCFNHYTLGIHKMYMLILIHVGRYLCYLEIHYVLPLYDGDHILDYSGSAYIYSDHDLRLCFRRGRKRTAVPANAPLGDVAQCGTETWSFRRKWIILLPAIFCDRRETDTYVCERKGARRKSVAAAKRRTRWRAGRSRACSLAPYNSLAENLWYIDSACYCWFVLIFFLFFIFTTMKAQTREFCRGFSIKYI